ncbi:MAG: hypothetical protein ACI4NF_04685 [Christensenellales bacterium]
MKKPAFQAPRTELAKTAETLNYRRTNHEREKRRHYGSRPKLKTVSGCGHGRTIEYYEKYTKQEGYN